MAPLKALSLSGRFSVMVRMFSAISYLIVSYAIGWVSSRFVLCRLVQASSCPGLSGASTFFLSHESKEDVDGRDKPGHDGVYRYFLGGDGHGRCGPRRPSNALAR